MSANDPWWIVREGTLGQIVSSFTPSQLLNLSVQWTAKQSATKPNATAMGPYPTQAAAKAAADAQNKSQAGLNSAAAAVVQDSFHGLNLGTWILRISEILLGIALLGIGVAKLTGADNVISKTVKDAGKAAVLA